MNTLNKVVPVTIACLLMTGCANTAESLMGALTPESNQSNTSEGGMDFSSFDVSSPVEELGKKDISTSRTVGQIIGAIVGGYACYKKFGGNKLLMAGCAGIGGIAGDQLGKYIGEAIAVRRMNYASNYEFLESEIEASENAIQTREEELAKTKQNISTMEERIDLLKSKASLTEAEIAEAQALLAEGKALRAENQLLEDRYTDTLSYLNSALEDSEEEIASLTEDKAKTQEAHEELLAKRDQLSMQLAAIQTQSSQLDEQNTALNSLIVG
ncbi:hypothetical protein C7Y69_10060 [Alteromonas sp. KS69]|jgi:outer membrane lipoprotein SlyB|uniref:hypothetical protein n=1 Tax=unclassified Alteromonas TaxID=2614992 RepID=UPI000F85CB16|nr:MULTISPECIES: hypothetical protein [unclassified Alteromonas]MBO7924183.1 hypothetical protein [Alteromonas sp. K632G]RUP80981.1 hypothetical protein C7Y69_10060 [Alteromonas sp. KS69]|tara:strand:- start:707 stop:1516 length:810 start_codon:yes stop_codon:yes gene_type:complete